MNKETKFQILWKKHNRDFTTEIAEHYTTLDRLIDNKDKFPYQDVEIIAKRQYTGLKDKNGKEVYEGDIAKCEYNVIYLAEFYMGAFQYKDRTGDVYVINEFPCEIIGNIHENPELLDNAK